MSTSHTDAVFHRTSICLRAFTRIGGRICSTGLRLRVSWLRRIDLHSEHGLQDEKDGWIALTDQRLRLAWNGNRKGPQMLSDIPRLPVLIQRAEPAGSLEGSTSQRISGREVLLVCLSALAMFTLLLLRLPYRTPVVNVLLSTLALASFYSYLRLRLNIRVPATMILCLVVSILLDVIGNRYGLFSRRILLFPYDIITHFAASGLSFLPVMWLLMKLIRRFGFRLPLSFVAFFSATTAFSLAAYYEITELLDERLLGGHRIWTPRDTVQDLAADLIGIVIAAICYSLAIRTRWRHDQSKSRPGVIETEA